MQGQDRAQREGGQKRGQPADDRDGAGADLGQLAQRGLHAKCGNGRDEAPARQLQQRGGDGLGDQVRAADDVALRVGREPPEGWAEGLAALFES